MTRSALFLAEKMALIVPLLFCAFLLNLTTMTGRVVHAIDGDAQRGRVVYEKHCLPCHGAQGKGDGQFGRVTSPPAADFTSAASKQKTDAQLLATIEKGRPPTAMEGWKGQLSDSEIHDVLTYVKTLRQ